MTGGADVKGLLYTPSLLTTDPCLNASLPYAPKSVTTQDNLPDFDYDLVAIAPWISPQCTQSYLASARSVPTRAFVFFLPNQGESMPPKVNDPSWDLGDGGQWKKQNEFPVYAIPTSSGVHLTTISGYYSGNMTSVPFGANISQYFDSRDYVRLAMDISTGTSGGLPGIWTFLLIILGILLAIVALVSLTMHLVLRKRRATLRQQVANGQVNLEALGIKQLTVPQEILDKMPLYTYESGNSRIADPSRKADSTAIESVPASGRLALAKTTNPERSHFDQPTCAICLDDFISIESTVRQLPCEHIFHPECVDIFLRDNSSLCPLCKKSALPKGYCPARITNAMVRRERHVRRLRPRDENNHGSHSSYNNPTPSRMFGWHGRRNATEDVELAGSATPAAPSEIRGADVTATSDQPPPVQQSARREWARRRALAMLGPRPSTTDIDTTTHTRSRWRQWMGKAFPALA